ncbi:hypothetical protein H9639_03905 [Arthrobacter sp. Sa2CUA1]|uniref:2'-5' RNA ligase n=1 Tax=Arthrobacter gallicola TaxID=2762225 RepID=A0ABR8UPH3_9MICC|nr:2'-5' RNA ligase family protein [Arthrobacter gallicola]MBD7994434.1 hypothetical protein [Arthrobacter gallicola]
MAPSLPDPDPVPTAGAPGIPGAFSGARIYAQLKPDGAGLAELLRLQAAARDRAPGTRRVSGGRLHLTLIHFGKADDAFGRLTVATGVETGAYDRALARYLRATAAALPEDDFVLEPRGLAGFGRDGSTLAVEFASTSTLDAVHRTLYGVLLDFLAACGVPDPAGYAAGDPALAFAARLHPHVSLLHGFHGFSGPPPVLDLRPVRLRPTPVLYRS